MPSVRALLRAPGAFCFALVRILRTAIIVGFAALALALLVVRFVVFPHVESYRDTLASTLSRELGHPVEIATLATGWDGWSPKLVVQGFRVLGRAGSGGSPLVDLPEIGLVVSWTSLPLWELRLKELVIERPRLAIRRNRAGILQVAGIEIDPAQMPDESSFADWVLRQRDIVIRDALITWDDDLRNAPQLVLDRVQFRLENRFGRHRFGLKGTPPAELAAPLDLRGELNGASLADWQHAEGALFVRLDYADVAAWREWLPLPGQIASGKGALRVWFQFDRGEPREIVADLELADVKARLDDGLPDLDLVHLSGRVGWRSTAKEREIFAQGLAFTTVTGERLDPTSVKLTLRDGAADRPSGQIEFDQLQLEPLVALGANLPLANHVRTDLARFAPRGTLTQGRLRWEGPAESPTSYAATGEFTNLGLIAQDAVPGVTGLTGRFNIANDRGEVRFASDNAVLALPRVFAAPIALDSLQSVVKWERRDGKTAVRVEQFEFANADVAGRVSGTFRTNAQGPGEIDVTAQASRVDARQVHRYLPRAIDDATRHWLRTALIGGAAADARLKIAGNLAQFPFVNGKGGQFVVTAKAKGVTLAYAEGWPPIESIDADLRFEGTRMKIDATRGRAFDVEIGKTHAEIADVAADAPLLRIDGEAGGPVAGFLRFVNDSPVAASIGQQGSRTQATGNGRLALTLGLPLRRLEDTKVNGEFAFADAQLRIAGVPTLAKVNGKLAFSERDVRAREITMEALGGPAKLAIASADGRTRVSGGGTLTLAALRHEYASGYLDRVSGSVDWTIAVNVGRGVSAWVVQSSMKGAVVDLPSPLGKNALETTPLKIEQRDDLAQPGTDFVTASYGRVAQFALHRNLVSDGATIDRALLSFGKAIERNDADRAERPGLWVRAELPALNADDWIALVRRETAAASARQEPIPRLAGADLDVGQFEALGVRFSDLKVGMRESQDGWSLDLSGREIAGTAGWSTPDAGAPNGRIVARLTRLALPGRAGFTPWKSIEANDPASDPKPDAAPGNPWPELDVAAASLVSKERDLGHLELVARPRGAEWRIDRLVLANDNGRLEAEGAWRVLARQQQTKLDIILNAKEPGPFLATFGYPDALQGAPTTINGQLAWAGAPHEFDFPSLSGTFHIGVGPGRFTRIEPGPAGKLLGVLSLQALPRRVALDFQDVFSEGFAFDAINGNVTIASGVMTTNNLKLTGPAAKVDIAGDADLANETQRLSVRVQPALSTSVSAGAALLFIANPLIGAAIGAGSWLAQTMLKDPIEKIFSYEYTVTGSWSDPLVARGAAATALVAPRTSVQPTVGVTR